MADAGYDAQDMPTADPCFSDIAGLGASLRNGSLSSAGLTRAYLERIEAFDPHYHCYVSVWAEEALAAAEAADIERARGIDLGPLHGIPVAIKDLVDVRGKPTLAGMPLRADHQAIEDATIVQRLRAAGAIILGKLALTEAASIPYHPNIDAPRNPWDARRSPGFSSSATGVAVAAGLCAAGVGSDTGGSIRIPSAFNGVTGVKTSWGRVSRHGVFSLVEYLDTVGPMARSAADAALMLRVMAGADARDPTTARGTVPDYARISSERASDLVIGVDWSGIEKDCDTAVLSGLRQTAWVFEILGAEIRSVKTPRLDLAGTMPLFVAGVADAHRDVFPSHRDAYGPALARLLDSAGAIKAGDIAAAINLSNRFRAQLADVLSDVDLLLVPAMPSTAPLLGMMEQAFSSDPAGTARMLAYTLPFNVSGSPSVTFPTDFADGLPVAGQLVGPPMSEGALLRAVGAFQRVTDWHMQRPPAPGAG